MYSYEMPASNIKITGQTTNMTFFVLRNKQNCRSRHPARQGAVDVLVCPFGE